MKPLVTRIALISALLFSPAARPSESDEVAELRAMLESMKQQYEARIEALETRLQQVENNAQPTTDNQTLARAPAPSPGRASANALNPALSLVLQGSAVDYSGDTEARALPGFQTGGEGGRKPEGLSATETEITASANVDDAFFAQATVGLHEDEGDTEVDLEEAFIDALQLPAGIGLRFGRFFPETGYLNTRHTHAWDFADAPLTHEAFLGGQYRDDGLRLTWLAPTDTYLELGVEALRGEEFPVGNDGSDAWGGAQNHFLRFGADVGVSHSFLAGLSHLRSEPDGRASGHAHGGESAEVFSFAGDSDLTGVDFVWKWAPDGNPRERNVIFQTEYFYRDESGTVAFENEAGSAELPYRGDQQGVYAQAVYQFMPRWRTGLRYDRLWSDNNLKVIANSSGESDEELLEESGLVGDHDPWRWTWMLDYKRTEFSWFRLQYARDHAQRDAQDQILLQYIMAFGAHNAHKF